MCVARYLPSNCLLKAATFLSYPSPSEVPWPWARSSTMGPDWAPGCWVPVGPPQAARTPPASRVLAFRKVLRRVAKAVGMVIDLLWASRYTGGGIRASGGRVVDQERNGTGAEPHLEQMEHRDGTRART